MSAVERASEVCSAEKANESKWSSTQRIGFTHFRPIVRADGISGQRMTLAQGGIPPRYWEIAERKNFQVNARSHKYLLIGCLSLLSLLETVFCYPIA